MAAMPLIHHRSAGQRSLRARFGRSAAWRNRCWAMPSLTLSFAVWMLWSAVVVQLPGAGFHFSINQLFWLTALPALCGATLQIAYAFAVPLLGGRRFTALSTASLLLPALGMGWALQNPDTSYETLVALALLCGLGGANLTHSMASNLPMGASWPQGSAPGPGAGLGTLGVALAQFVVPLAVGVEIFGALGGAPQAGVQGLVWLQNAGYIWAPLIAGSAVAAWFGMRDLADSKTRFAEQAVIFGRKHTWLMGCLCLGTFGSFIGLSAGLPLLMQSQLPHHELLQLAWLGPLLGALAWPLGGWLAQRHGAGRITCWCFATMVLGTAAALQCLPGSGQGGNVPGLLGAFGVVFAASGMGHASTLRMIPTIFLTQRQRLAPALPGSQAQAQAQATAAGQIEAAGVLGLAGAIGAYGGFFIPKSLGTAIAMTGSPAAALRVFIVFYLSCLALTWWHYSRRHAPMPC